MNPIQTHSTEAPLSAGFATRVLRKADVEIARRRIRRIVAGSMGVLAIAVISTGAALFSTRIAPPQGPVVAEASNLEGPAARADDRADPLDYLLPDAAPLAQFAVQYSDATDGAVAGDDILGEQDADFR
ncbi:MAG TPA: hypothetical protein VGI20_07065 [Rhizomicrobium sp.]|jgi:hypothetical protein